MLTMDTRKRAIDSADAEVDEIRRHVAALADASTERHRLMRGTPEYADALETELRLADRVWQLGTALRPSPGRHPEQGTRPGAKRRKH